MKALTPNERISRRNYLLMIFEGSVFWIAASFIDGNNVVSVFINEANDRFCIWLRPVKNKD